MDVLEDDDERRSAASVSSSFRDAPEELLERELRVRRPIAAATRSATSWSPLPTGREPVARLVRAVVVARSPAACADDLDERPEGDAAP